MWSNTRNICALVLVVRAAANMACLLVLHRLHKAQQLLLAATRSLEPNVRPLRVVHYAMQLLPFVPDSDLPACQAPSRIKLLVGGSQSLNEYEHCVESLRMQLLWLKCVGCLLLAFLALCTLLPFLSRRLPQSSTLKVEEQTPIDPDNGRVHPNLQPCTWCPEADCYPCCPEHRRPNASCPSSPHSTCCCCCCCPAPDCSCCSDPDCYCSLGCTYWESHCCTTQECFRRSKNTGGLTLGPACPET